MWVLLVGAGSWEATNRQQIVIFSSFLVFEILVLPIARVDVSDFDNV